MKSLIYQIEFFDYWHAGTGLISGANSDALVQKDSNGLPFIPGKTLKGLLREAAEILLSLHHSEITEDFIKRAFGEEKEDEDNDHIRKEADSFFGNAYLSKNLSNSITANQQSKFLYQQVASTAIASNGQAKDYSLRSIEVTVPLVLYGKIVDFKEKDLSAIKTCFRWIKRMGLNRNRGLGRCQFTAYSLENENQQA